MTVEMVILLEWFAATGCGAFSVYSSWKRQKADARRGESEAAKPVVQLGQRAVATVRTALQAAEPYTRAKPGSGRLTHAQYRPANAFPQMRERFRHRLEWKRLQPQPIQRLSHHLGEQS